MKTVLVLILLFFKGLLVKVYLLTENNFNGDIRNFAVGNGKVFVVTDSQIIQMKHDLIVEERRDISNHTHPNTVTILLPFHTNKTLITCGTSGCYCEVLDLNNISTSIYRENTLAGPFVDESSVSFLVDFNQSATETGAYMLVAREKEENNNQKPQYKNCAHNGNVTLWNTLHSQNGDIFSKIGPQTDATDYSISLGGDVEWVDGFQTSHPSHSYLLVNVQSGTAPAVIVLKMENSNSKSDMIKYLHGSELQCCDDKPRRKLLSSSVVISSGSPLYWVGVFAAHEDRENTVLAIYDFSQITNHVPSQFSCKPSCTAEKGDAVLTPSAVVLNHTSMTSVAAEKKGSWIVIYIGTRNGQLMKMVLDKELRSSCVTVLYRSDDDRMVFPRMHFDQGDDKHIYIALRNQIRRVAVTQCDVYKTLRDCRDSQDPLCGWCVTTSMCSTNDECSDSSWISIPEDSFQKNLIKFYTRKSFTNVTLELHLNLKGTHKPTLTCTFKVGDRNLCSSSADFPDCSCSFSSERLPANVTATVSIGNQILTESLKLRSCPNITENSPYAQCVACVSAGCDWSNSNKKCNWSSGSDSNPAFNDACQGLSSGENAPIITSLEPSLVSFHGRNNAVIKGKNLRLVEKIRFQGFMECTVTETKVLDGSSDTLLKFKIPKGNKGNAKVCVVTADGQCHSSAIITYSSMTTCTGLQPTVSWASGGRMIEVLGSSLKTVDKIIVNKKESRIRSSQRSEKLWFYTPPLLMGYGYFSVSLRRGKSSVVCADKLSYLPDPEFISFSTSLYLNDVQVFINKKTDRLDVREEDVKVWGLHEDKQFECLVEKVISTAIVCNILRAQEFSIDVDSLRISVGYFSTVLKTRVKNTHSLFCVKELS